jgi:hypothetical protein
MGQVVEAGSGIWMLRTQRLFADRQCSLMERLGLVVLSLFLEHTGQVVEARSGIWMLRTQYLFVDLEGSLIEWLSFPIGSNHMQMVPKRIAQEGIQFIRAALRPLDKGPQMWLKGEHWCRISSRVQLASNHS